MTCLKTVKITIVIPPLSHVLLTVNYGWISSFIASASYLPTSKISFSLVEKGYETELSTSISWNQGGINLFFDALKN